MIRFNNKAECDAAIEAAELQSKSITGCIDYTYNAIYDSNPKLSYSEELNEPGTLYVVFLKEASFLQQIRASDLILKGDTYVAGFNLSESMFMEKESDTIWKSDTSFQKSLCLYIAMTLNHKIPQLKKKVKN